MEEASYSCSICLESFNNRYPFILSCGHSFCGDCLSSLADVTICSICRKKVFFAIPNAVFWRDSLTDEAIQYKFSHLQGLLNLTVNPLIISLTNGGTNNIVFLTERNEEVEYLANTRINAEIIPMYDGNDNGELVSTSASHDVVLYASLCILLFGGAAVAIICVFVFT